MASAAAMQRDLVVRDPEDGAVIATVARASATDVEDALHLASRAFAASPMPTWQRADILERLAVGIRGANERLAETIAREGIKTIREARREVERAATTIALSASAARQLDGGQMPFDQAAAAADRRGYWVRKPAGIVIAITPYNDPLNLVAHKVGPAFAVGCPVIVKPHPQTPLSALYLAEIAHEAGVPEAMFQVLAGGTDVARALVSDARPRIVSYTGGRPGGEVIARIAGLKRLVMELGGIGVVGVAADADLALAATAIHEGAFWAAGQNCVHAQRIVAEAAVIEALSDALLRLAADMSLGRKLDPDTDMGPLVDAAAADRLAGLCARAVADGARLLCGGAARGSRLAPTWIADLSPGHVLLDTELFGPVSTLESVADTAQLLHRLGQAPASINAAVFTRSLATAFDAFDFARAGAVIVNDSTDFRIDAMPFGGPGTAGLGREGIVDAVDAFTEKKLLVVRP